MATLEDGPEDLSSPESCLERPSECDTAEPKISLHEAFQTVRKVICSLPYVRFAEEPSMLSMSKERTLRYAISIISLLDDNAKELEHEISTLNVQQATQLSDCDFDFIISERLTPVHELQ